MILSLLSNLEKVYLNSLSPGFHICKMGLLIIVSTSYAYENEMIIYVSYRHLLWKSSDHHQCSRAPTFAISSSWAPRWTPFPSLPCGQVWPVTEF